MDDKATLLLCLVIILLAYHFYNDPPNGPDAHV